MNYNCVSFNSVFLCVTVLRICAPKSETEWRLFWKFRLRDQFIYSWYLYRQGMPNKPMLQGVCDAHTILSLYTLIYVKLNKSVHTHISHSVFPPDILCVFTMDLIYNCLFIPEDFFPFQKIFFLMQIMGHKRRKLLQYEWSKTAYAEAAYKAVFIKHEID